MIKWRKTFKDFYPFRIASRLPSQRENEYIYLNQLFHKCLIASIALIVIIFQFNKHWDSRIEDIPEIADVEFYIIDEIPITRQDIKRPIPPRPKVPIPSDEPTIPEDLTIEETELDDLPLPPIEPLGISTGGVTPPRPIAEVFPEYPVSEKKSGVQGVIELALFVEKDGVVTNVQIVKNSTLSKKCENSAIQAAYKTRFLPAKRKNEKIAVWINKIYKFGIN